MRKIIYFSLLTFILTSCKTYIQVNETKTTNTNLENGYYVFENDTLKVTYSFWAERGVLSFAVYNKLNIPIYIDWKKSSYIDNSNKFNYWVDEEVSNSASYYGSYFYQGTPLKVGVSMSEGIGTGVATKIKIERKTFIPPKSNYYRSQFYLSGKSYYKFTDKMTSTEVKRNDKRKKNTKIFEESFTIEDSPLVFRNFLAFSLTEDFEQEFYIDNEFYLSNIMEMNYKHFSYVDKSKKEKKRVKPTKKMTSFYIYKPAQFDSTYWNKHGILE